MKRTIAGLLASVMLIASPIVHSSALTSDEIELARSKFAEMQNELIASGKEYDIEANVYDTPSNAPLASENDPIETQFLADMSAALKARWTLSEREIETDNPEILRNFRKKMVGAEKSKIAKYADAKFTDPVLGLLASTYLTALNNQEIANAQYFGIDDNLFQTYWTDYGSNYRFVIIYLLNQYYSLTIDINHYGTYADTLINGFLMLPDDVISYLLDIKDVSNLPTEENNDSQTQEDDGDVPVIPNLLYEDKNLSITYSTIYSEVVGSSSFLNVELLFENKTDSIIELVADAIIINGYSISLSKYVDIPAKCKYLNNWVSGAEQFDKLKITSIDEAAIVFNYSNSDGTVKLSTTQTKPVPIVEASELPLNQKTEITPTHEPTATPTSKPTATPTSEPTASPTPKPTTMSTLAPTAIPQSSANDTKLDDGAFVLRNGIHFGDSIEEVRSKETLALNLNDDGNLMVSEEGTIASIEGSNVGYRFGENGLYAMYYNFRPALATNENNDPSDVAVVRGFDLSTINKGLKEKYGDPLEADSKYTKIVTEDASTYKELIALMKLSALMGNGSTAAKQRAAEKFGEKGYEYVVLLPDGIVKIDHFVYVMNDISFHQLAYQYYTNEQVESILNGGSTSDSVRNDI